MVKSMTGYGQAKSEGASVFTAEVKSVNNRYLDISVKLPRKYLALEGDVRNCVKEHVGRGKVDVFINVDEEDASGEEVAVNEALAAKYAEAIRRAGRAAGCEEERPFTAFQIATLPEVMDFKEAPVDEEAVRAVLIPCVEAALSRFNEARAAEGEKLKDDMLLKLDELSGCVGRVIEEEPKIVAAYREKLLSKVNEILADRTADDTAVAAACASYADKISTDEESVRLKSHIDQMRQILSEGGSVGRKLDFMAQEMNREANTTLSKAGSLVTADTGIAMKTIIEKLREQIQNLE